jgi:hypothetical protein
MSKSQADEADDFGPAMTACLPAERAFVLALLEGKSNAEAAKLSGWGNDAGTTTMATFGRIANRALSRSRVIDALQEEARKTIKSLVPSAITAVKDILTNTTHKDRAKVALNLIERTSPTVTQHNVTIEHKVDHDAEAVAQLRMLKSLGVARERLEEVFGFSGLSRYENLLAIEDAKNKPAIVDAEYTVVDADLDAAIAAEMENL